MGSSRIFGNVPEQPGLPTHLRLPELMAAGDHLTTRKTVVLEWVGEVDPMVDPVIQFRIATGEFSPLEIEALRSAAVRAVTRAGNRRRILEAANDPRSLAPVPGLLRTYCWERRNQYRVEATIRDADVILSSDCGHEFVLR